MAGMVTCEESRNMFAKIMILFAYWNLLLLVISGENLFLVTSVAGLFTALLILIYSSAYRRLIARKK